MKLWGLKTCDSCRKALKALDEAGAPAEFVDVRKALDAETLGRWVAAVGAEALLNRSSTTWRGLSDAEKAGDPAAVMLAHPSLVKRPVIEAEGAVLVGKGAVAAALARAGKS